MDGIFKLTLVPWLLPGVGKDDRVICRLDLSQHSSDLGSSVLMDVRGVLL